MPTKRKRIIATSLDIDDFTSLFRENISPPYSILDIRTWFGRKKGMLGRIRGRRFWVWENTTGLIDPPTLTGEIRDDGTVEFQIRKGKWHVIVGLTFFVLGIPAIAWSLKSGQPLFAGFCALFMIVALLTSLFIHVIQTSYCDSFEKRFAALLSVRDES